MFSKTFSLVNVVSKAVISAVQNKSSERRSGRLALILKLVTINICQHYIYVYHRLIKLGVVLPWSLKAQIMPGMFAESRACD